MTAEIFRSGLLVPTDRTIVAYDGMEWPQIIETAQEVGPHTGIGKTNDANVDEGAKKSVNVLAENGQLAMLDFKFHDIPGTVERSVRKATRTGGALITVHASGGKEMLEAAVSGAEKGRADIKDIFKRSSLPTIGHILGITVLTSLDAEDCFSIFGIPKEDEDGIKKKVLQFTDMAMDAGLTGIVCSPLETQAIRSESRFDSLLVVNPGITPIFAKKAGDQKRTTNATEAINAGADMIVVGGGINNASDYGMSKAEAAQAIGEEISSALRGGNE